jgi:hypothetical protein
LITHNYPSQSYKITTICNYNDHFQSLQPVLYRQNLDQPIVIFDDIILNLRVQFYFSLEVFLEYVLHTSHDSLDIEQIHSSLDPHHFDEIQQS